MVGTDLMMSTTNHPQTDGQTERMIRSILQIYRHFVNANDPDWLQHPPTVKFEINSAVRARLRKCLLKLSMDIVFNHFLLLYSIQIPDNPALMDFLENRMLSQLSAQDSIIAAKREQSHHMNKKDPEIAEGNLVVMNETQVTHLLKGRQKLVTKWVGPYKVNQVDKLKSIIRWKLETRNSILPPMCRISERMW
jgi:hypothetical protein